MLTNRPLHPLAAVALATVTAATAAPASLPAQPAPAGGGFSAERLARIDSVFQGAVDRGELAGAVALVLRDGAPVYERAIGWADREAGRRMTPTTLFRIASQTKALTSVAVMMLVEEGRLGLSDPVARYLPAFARTSVAVRADTGRAIVPARRAITIRDLLTHTSGVSYGTDSVVAPLYAGRGLGPAAGYGWYLADKPVPICTTVDQIAALPFVAQPGERFVYGYSTDILGCLVERVSGVPLDAFFRDRITGPLGMRDTRFFIPASERTRLATVYASAGPPPGGTRAAPVRPAPAGARGQGDYVDGPRVSFSGGAGLTSTARDYARFLEMLRNGGALGGVRLLGPKTVALMTTNQTGTLFSSGGEGFGLGFQVLERAGANGRAESVGTFGWGGAYGSTYEVDPQEGIVLVVLTQQLPNASDALGRFPMLVYQAFVAPHGAPRGTSGAAPSADSRGER
ncbi:MAG TPA: serine hydrolase domain-containing protein [Gemmatirosa sp.]